MHRKINLEDLLKLIKIVVDRQFINKDFCIKTLSEMLELDQMKKSKSLSKNIGAKFKERYGYKINDRINYLRVELAKKLLRKNYLNTSEIAGICGFSNGTYFYSVFRKIEGMSPAQYKNKVLPYSGS